MPDSKAIVLPPFVGYATLEDWLEAIDPARPVFVLKVAEPSPHNGGAHVEDLMVHCQQVSSECAVHYVRLRAASVTLCSGEPFDAGWKDREAAWESLWECVKETLEKEGLTIRKATVARPKQLVLLEGKAGRIAYDEVSRRFVPGR